MESLDALIQQYIDQQAASGAAVAILQNGDITHSGGYGTTSVEEDGIQVTPQTLFAYGSISKTICATLIMRLVEHGLLDLDAPVVAYLPGLQFSRADYGRKITLRHLLSHTSGLPAHGKYWGPRDPDSLGRFVYEQIPFYQFLAEPGEVHLYSSTVICIAGHVAEAVTGKYYDDLVQEHVCDPLQMTRVTYDPAVAMTYPLALPHESSPDGKAYVVHRMAYNASGNPSSFAYGSVADLANLAKMYLNQGRFGEQSFLTAASVTEMHRLHASRHIEAAAHPLAQANQGYGLGFNTGHYRGRRAARHGGMSQSFNCFFDLFPDDQAGVVLLTNYSQEGALMELVAALYDHALDLPHRGIVYLENPAPVSEPLERSQLQRYAGVYLNVETAGLARFVLDGDQLMLERQGESETLIPYGKGKFYADLSDTYRVPVVFLHGPDGKVSHVMMAGEPYFPFEPDPEFRPDVDLWKTYEGVYKDPSNANSEEMISVRLQDGVLFVAEGDHEAPAKAVSERCFLSEVGLIEFEDTGLDRVKVLVWGKATRFYPLDEHAYRANGIVKYLVGAPVAPQRVA